MVGKEVAVSGIAGVRAAQAGFIRKHAPDFGRDAVHAFAQLDGVVVAFGHFAPVKTGAFGLRGEARFRLGKKVAVQMVETATDFPRHLKVRHLILANRHPARPVHDDIRRLQHRIAEKAVGAEILVRKLLQLLLVSGAAFQPAHRGKHGEQKVQLCMLCNL